MPIPEITAAMLELRDVSTGYGRAQALFELSLVVGEGEVVVLLGRNGAGKSTTLKTIAGMLRPWRGEIIFKGERIEQLPPWRIAQRGIGYVPEERRIFTDLTVGENLEVGTRAPPYGARPWTFERVVALFPNLAALRDRPAGEISGGEQQMLATARTLMGNPRLLLLDEPSEGLAPAIVQQMVHAIRELRREGVSVLLSEQNLALARAVAERTYVLESGHLRYVGPLATFADSTARHEYLGLD